MTRRILRLALVLALPLATIVPALRAFVFLEGIPAWPDGTVTLELQLGNAPVYSDGTTPNQTAIQAINEWNPSMARLKFEYVSGSTAAKSSTNGKNNVFFDSKIFGTAFPDGVLAVTTGRGDASGPVEMDVVVNTAWQWDSYRGYLQFPKIDLRRVLAHEFGHVLTLDHPDQHGQYVTALMNAYVSDIEGTQQDDKDGVSARYGHGPGNPTIPPTFQPGEPWDATVLEGAYVSFSAFATGTQPIALQWLKDGQPVIGATGYSLVLPAATFADAGKYALRATNTGGTVLSREATLVVQGALPPTIVTHPESKTVQHSGSFQISVSASSNAPISFQWTKNDVPVPGATWSTYSPQNVQPSDAGAYRAVLTTAGGSATSNPAVITVVPATLPVFTQHPGSLTVEEGAHASFSTGITSAVSVTYQWIHDDVAIPGATGQSLTLPSVGAADAGSYHLVATNAGGAVSSDAAVLTVNPTQPPLFTQHPANTTLEATTSLYLSAAVTSAVTVTYQWTKNGTPIAGATDRYLRILNVSLADSGEYRLVATNRAGSATSQPAVVTILAPSLPVFAVQPNGGTVEVGGSLYLTGHVNSSTSVTYHWTRDNIRLPDIDLNAYYIIGATAGHAGTYRLHATNAGGTVASEPAVVMVIPAQPPKFLTQPTSTTVEVGASLYLSSHASSQSPITYQWVHDGKVIPDATSTGYGVPAVTAADAGTYVLRATNLGGTTSSSPATVTVIPTKPPAITGHPHPTTVQIDASASFSVSYQSAVPATVQWTKDGAGIPGATSTHLGFAKATAADAGSYAAMVTNSAGSVTSNAAALTVVPTQAPKFISHPSGGVSQAGASRTLSSSVQSAVYFNMQWTRDGVAIPGATNKTLTLAPVTPAHAGIYRAVATNSAGATLSNTATVKVVPLQPPQFTRQPQAITAETGGSYQLEGMVSSAVPATYQWYRDGIALSSQTSPIIYLNSIKASDAGIYQLTATNAAGTTTSAGAKVEVIPAHPPEFTLHPIGATVERGAFVGMHTLTRSASPVSYQWFRDGNPVAGTANEFLSINGITDEQAGSYTVVATNSAGSTTSQPAAIVVTPPGPPRYARQPVGAFVLAGQQVSLNAYAESIANITYQWYKDGEPVPSATSSYLNFGNFTAADVGGYHQVATNIHGSTASATAELVLVPPPLPERIQLENIFAAEGANVVISVTQFEFWGPMTYQWYRDGTLLPGATSGSLTFSPVAATDSGEYFATVSNAAGTVTSTTCVLTVKPYVNGTIPGWNTGRRAGDTVFLMDPLLNRIDRCDLGTDTELPPISLASTPTTFTADATHLYVASGPDILRMGHDGSAPAPFATVHTNIAAMVATGGRLFALLRSDNWDISNQVVSLRLADATLEAVSPQLDGGTSAFAVDAAAGRVFGTAQYVGGNARSMLALDIGPDGMFGPVESNAATERYPNSSQVFTYPGRPWIIDGAGTVYQAGDLHPVGSLGMAVDSIDFTADGEIVAVRGQVISIYDDTLCLLRRIRLSRPARYVFVDGDEIVALAQVTGGAATIAAERHPLRPAAAQDPAPAPNPATLTFIPDAVATDRDGNLLLLSRLHQAVFRWDSRQQRYTAAIRVDGFPSHMACITATNTVVLGYADHALAAIDLDGPLVPRSIGAVPWNIAAFSSADSYLVVLAGQWTDPKSIAFLGSEGEVVALASWQGFNDQVRWSAADSRLYFFSSLVATDPSVAFQPVSPTLEIGFTETLKASLPTSTWQRLLRVSPDGRTLAMHNGQILDTGSASAPVESVAPFIDAAWLADRMFVAGDASVGSEVRRLAPDRTDAMRIELGGRMLHLYAVGADRLVAVTTKGGRTHLTLLDADLNVRNHFEDTPDLTKVALTNLSTRAEVGTGDNIIIAGFVVTGSQSKRILVRAVGPELNRFGVAGTLADPVLKVISDAGPVAENDNWSTPDGEAMKAAFREVFAFGLADNSLDSALVAELAPGKYTAQVSGKDGGQGVALVEAYDLDANPGERRLINISTRAVVGVGDKVLIPGLAIEGSAPKRLLIRAANAFRLASGGRDAALVVTLPPGSYTVVVSGVGDTSGVALVEVYEVP